MQQQLINQHQKQRGFTLIEVMIVALIIAILGGIAYPSYMNQVRKTGRTDAKVALGDVAQRLQRCFTTNSTYKPDDEDVCTVVDEVTSSAGIESPDGKYKITMDDAEHTASTFELIAEPVAGDLQEGDEECAVFKLNQAGKRYSESSDGAETTDDCW